MREILFLFLVSSALCAGQLPIKSGDENQILKLVTRVASRSKELMTGNKNDYDKFTQDLCEEYSTQPYLREKCQEFTQKIPSVVSFTVNNYNPRHIARMLSSPLESFRVNANSLVMCKACKLVVNIIKFDVNVMNMSSQAVKTAIEYLCDTLAPLKVQKQVCHDIMNAIDDIIQKLLHGLTPGAICDDLKFCTNDTLPSFTIPSGYHGNQRSLINPIGDWVTRFMNSTNVLFLHGIKKVRQTPKYPLLRNKVDKKYHRRHHQGHHMRRHNRHHHPHQRRHHHPHHRPHHHPHHHSHHHPHHHSHHHPHHRNHSHHHSHHHNHSHHHPHHRNHSHHYPHHHNHSHHYPHHHNHSHHHPHHHNHSHHDSHHRHHSKQHNRTTEDNNMETEMNVAGKGNIIKIDEKNTPIYVSKETTKKNEDIKAVDNFNNMEREDAKDSDIGNEVADKADTTDDVISILNEPARDEVERPTPLCYEPLCPGYGRDSLKTRDGGGIYFRDASRSIDEYLRKIPKLITNRMKTLHPRRRSGGVTCTLCKMIVGYIDWEVKTVNTSVEAIEKAVRAMCEVYPIKVATEVCDRIVDKIDDVIQLVENGIEPGDICERLKLCNGKKFISMFTQLVRIPKKCSPLCSLMRAIYNNNMMVTVDLWNTAKNDLMKFCERNNILSMCEKRFINFETSERSLSNAVSPRVEKLKQCQCFGRQSRVSRENGNMCQMCKQFLQGLISEVAEVNKTVTLLINTLREMCDLFPDVSKQCNGIADQFETGFAAIVDKLINPNVCEVIGLCKNGTKTGETHRSSMKRISHIKKVTEEIRKLKGLAGKNPFLLRGSPMIPRDFVSPPCFFCKTCMNELQKSINSTTDSFERMSIITERLKIFCEKYNDGKEERHICNTIADGMDKVGSIIVASEDGEKPCRMLGIC